jgi:hypothetical protein
LEEFYADRTAGDPNERFDVGASFVADARAAVPVQPGDRALDRSALAAEPRAVRLIRPADLRADAADA